MRHKHNPGVICAIYCDGKRDLHGKDPFTAISLWSENAAHSLKSRFGLASDQYSLASAESYLDHLGYDERTIKRYTRIIEKTVEQYMLSGVFEDENERLPICTFSPNYYLGIHLDDQKLSDPAVLEVLKDDIRRKLVMDRLGMGQDRIIANAPAAGNNY